jgi:hypothetical protein
MYSDVADNVFVDDVDVGNFVDFTYMKPISMYEDKETTVKAKIIDAGDYIQHRENPGDGSLDLLIPSENARSSIYRLEPGSGPAGDVIRILKGANPRHDRLLFKEFSVKRHQKSMDPEFDMF